MTRTRGSTQTAAQKPGTSCRPIPPAGTQTDPRTLRRAAAHTHSPAQPSRVGAGGDPVPPTYSPPLRSPPPRPHTCLLSSASLRSPSSPAPTPAPIPTFTLRSPSAPPLRPSSPGAPSRPPAPVASAFSFVPSPSRPHPPDAPCGASRDSPRTLGSPEASSFVSAPRPPSAAPLAPHSPPRPRPGRGERARPSAAGSFFSLSGGALAPPARSRRRSRLCRGPSSRDPPSPGRGAARRPSHSDRLFLGGRAGRIRGCGTPRGWLREARAPRRAAGASGPGPGRCGRQGWCWPSVPRPPPCEPKLGISTPGEFCTPPFMSLKGCGGGPAPPTPQL